MTRATHHAAQDAAATRAQAEDAAAAAARPSAAPFSPMKDTTPEARAAALATHVLAVVAGAAPRLPLRVKVPCQYSDARDIVHALCIMRARVPERAFEGRAYVKRARPYAPEGQHRHVVIVTDCKPAAARVRNSDALLVAGEAPRHRAFWLALAELVAILVVLSGSVDKWTTFDDTPWARRNAAWHARADQETPYAIAAFVAVSLCGAMLLYTVTTRNDMAYIDATDTEPWRAWRRVHLGALAFYPRE